MTRQEKSIDASFISISCLVARSSIIDFSINFVYYNTIVYTMYCISSNKRAGICFLRDRWNLAFNPSSAVWVEAVINMFATETGRDHDGINVQCLGHGNKMNSFSDIWKLLMHEGGRCLFLLLARVSHEYH